MDQVAASPLTTPRAGTPTVNPVRDGLRYGSAGATDPRPATPHDNTQPPVRDGSRYGSTGAGAGLVTCLLCPAPRSSSRAQYCSASCKQRAYRLRQAAPAQPPGPAGASLRARLRRLGTLVEHTVYQCPTCDQRFLGQQRCEDCNRFCRALGLGGACPECDQPLLIDDLLGLAVTS